jgi:transposase
MADLREEQWNLVQSFIPQSIHATTRGRPPVDPRKVLNGILWIMRTGAPWSDLPRRYGAYQTCHRYFQKWVKEWVLDTILKALAEDLRRRGKIDLSECFIDATFAGAKKGVRTLDLQSVGKGARSWQFQTAMVFLSPFVLPEPISTKENWLKGPLITVSSAQSQEDWWEIRHTTTILSTEDVGEEEFE